MKQRKYYYSTESGNLYSCEPGYGESSPRFVKITCTELVTTESSVTLKTTVLNKSTTMAFNDKFHVKRGSDAIIEVREEQFDALQIVSSMISIAMRVHNNVAHGNVLKNQLSGLINQIIGK